MNDPHADADKQPESGREKIDRRFLEDKAEGRKEVVDAATKASEADRQDSDSVENRERTFEVEDPSHSKGSGRRKS